MRGLLLAILATFSLMPVARAASPERPNIVFVLMDNLGYGEVGVYGGGVTRGAPTPRIDRLASEGTRLTNFNVEAQCTPSRSAFLTGRFAIRSGTHSVPLPGSLDQDQAANAGVLARAGGAMMILQNDFSPQRLAGELSTLLAEPQRLTAMAQAAKSAGIPDAADRLARLVLQTAQG